MAQTSFQLSDDLDEWIESRLTYGQSKAQWLRYAVQSTHEVDEILDELYEEHQYDERREFIVKAVSEKVGETKKDPHRGNGG